MKWIYKFFAITSGAIAIFYGSGVILAMLNGDDAIKEAAERMFFIKAMVYALWSDLMWRKRG